MDHVAREPGRGGRPGWAVTLSRGGRRRRQRFPDDRFGGREPALAVARAWRDAVMAAVPPLTNIELRQVVRARRPGMPGVRRNANRDTWRATSQFDFEGFASHTANPAMFRV